MYESKKQFAVKREHLPVMLRGQAAMLLLDGVLENQSPLSDPSPSWKRRCAAG
jgi:hypothetical protein